MSEQKTHAEITAEMRKVHYSDEVTGDFVHYADELDVAHKREIEDAERRGNHAATKAICETIEKVGPLYDVESVGNAAKLRDALVRVRDFADRIVEDRGLALAIINACDAALAEPPRNCDVFDDAQQAWRARLDDTDNWDDFGSPKLGPFEWLLAPATEKEGGAK